MSTSLQTILLENFFMKVFILYNLSNYTYLLPSFPTTGYGFTSSYCVDVRTPDDNILVLTCFEQQECQEVNQSSHSWKSLLRYFFQASYEGDAYQILFTFLGVISQIFLVITFLVYVVIPDLNNMHGKIVLSNVVSMFVVTLYLLIVYNTSPQSTWTCSALGYVVRCITRPRLLCNLPLLCCRDIASASPCLSG